MNTIFHLKKALFYSTILLSLIILLEGCKKKSTVEDFGTRIDQCYEDRIDTTLMADGTMFIETPGTARLNSAVDVIDKHGKLLAQGACCSERTIFNFIRYLYDDNERIKGLIHFSGDTEKDYGEKQEIELFRKQVFDDNWNREEYSRYNFEYDNKGHIVRINDPITHDHIQAPANHKIEFKVIPNSLFWSSDLDGGVYLLDINIVPIDPKCKDYIKMNYCFYTPILLEEYKNNIKVKSTALSSYSSHSIQL